MFEINTKNSLATDKLLVDIQVEIEILQQKNTSLTLEIKERERNLTNYIFVV